MPGITRRWDRQRTYYRDIQFITGNTPASSADIWQNESLQPAYHVTFQGSKQFSPKWGVAHRPGEITIQGLYLVRLFT